MGVYGGYCPVAKTSEILSERWMPMILRELMTGSERFSEVRQGIPTISPAMLTKRLRQLEAAGVIDRSPDARYALTEAGRELAPIIEAMAVWGHRWARTDYRPDDLDPGFLMWDMRKNLRADGLAEGRAVIAFRFSRAPRGKTHYWLVVDDGIDLCLVDPGHEVDLWVDADLKALTMVWLGDRSMRSCLQDGSIELAGDRGLARRLPDWLGAHPSLGDVADARAS